MCLFQYKVSNKSKVDEQSDVLKVTKLQGDHLLKELVAKSYYDTKPIYVYYIATAVEDVGWIVKSREMYINVLETNFSS